MKSEEMRSKRCYLKIRFLRGPIIRSFQFLGSRPTVNMCPDTISIATRLKKSQASVFLCHPWISMLAHTVHQCIYQSAITCKQRKTDIYLKYFSRSSQGSGVPINTNGKLSVDRNPESYSYSSKKNICNIRRCSRVGQHIEYAGKSHMRGGKISYILYAYMAGGVVSFSIKQIFSYNKRG